MHTLSELDALVLVGGQGTRLRPVVADRPKPLAEIGGRPFLTYLLDFLALAGIRRATLCTGYRAEMIQAELGQHYGPLCLRYSPETEPRGTAGAVRAALPRVESSTLLVANGDSLCEADLEEFLRFHRKRNAAVSMLLTWVDDCSRFGQIRCDEAGRIVRFAEKQQSAGPGWINAGVYLIERTVLHVWPAGRLSFEHEVFPALAHGGDRRAIGAMLRPMPMAANDPSSTLLGWPGGGAFLDIGTPESMADAESWLRSFRGQRSGGLVEAAVQRR
jgi:NDP-sugar pyrophosphorylase family protein